MRMMMSRSKNAKQKIDAQPTLVAPLADAPFQYERAITDKLRSYGAAKRALALNLEHRSHKGLNSPAEGFHKPTRRREQVMGRFKSSLHAQQFLSAHDQINVLFRPRRHRLTAKSYRHARSDATCLHGFLACQISKPSARLRIRQMVF